MLLNSDDILTPVYNSDHTETARMIHTVSVDTLRFLQQTKVSDAASTQSWVHSVLLELGTSLQQRLLD